MKVLLSADMEGVTGVTAPDDVRPGTAAFERFRRLFVRDVNAAIEGAFEGGATELLVNEAHGGMRNLLIEELDARAALLSGHHKTFLMMEGIDRDVDMVLLVGYHAPAGAAGVLSHTFLGRGLTDVTVNEQICSEARMNAMLAASFGVAVGLLTGDQAACEDAARYIPGIRTVAVKKQIDQYAAICLPPARTEPLIREAAANACRDAETHRALVLDPPFRWKVSLTSPSLASRAALIPTVERVGTNTILWSSYDFASSFKAFQAVALIVGTSLE